MAETETYDCPATPEVLPVGDSPILVRENLDTSCESDLDDMPTDGRGSPPPKCAICLGKCKNKSFTDSCLHQFCFKCLLEWSKIKAECPLCKQIFRSIIHNVRSVEQFDEYVVRPPVAQPSMPHPYIIPPHMVGMPPSVYHRLDFMLSEPPRFTYSATLQVGTQQSEAIEQLFMHRSPSIDRFSREYANDQIPYRQHGGEWRQYIYNRRLYAMPLLDVSGRMRECSAAFYRDNPAQIHRLMPWINRELVALFRDNRMQIDIVMNYFPELLIRHDISSVEFRNHVQYWDNERTDHFIHELLNYARSPFDMIGYDRNVRYSPRFNTSSSDSQVVTLSSTDNETDIEDLVRVRPSRRRTQFTIETRSSHSTVIVTGSFGDGDGDPSVNVSTAGTTSGNNTATSNTATSCRLIPLPLPRIASNISLSSSDSDDILFVREQKPPHLRTPELVSLNSESDSDVMFVEENQHGATGQTAENTNTNSNSNSSSSNFRNAGKKAPPPGIFEPTVTSEDSGCNSNNNLSHSIDIKDLPSTSSAFSPKQINEGASTSGEHSGTLSGRKYYARPRLNHVPNMGRKSIYESSDSDTSSSDTDSDAEANSRKKRKRKCQSSDSDFGVKKTKKANKSKSSRSKACRRKKTKKKESNSCTSSSRKMGKTAIKRSQSSESVVKDVKPEVVKKERKPKLKSVVIKKYSAESPSSSSESSSDFQESYNESFSDMSDKSWDF